MTPLQPSIVVAVVFSTTVYLDLLHMDASRNNKYEHDLPVLFAFCEVLQWIYNMKSRDAMQHAVKCINATPVDFVAVLQFAVIYIKSAKYDFVVCLQFVVIYNKITKCDPAFVLHLVVIYKEMQVPI